MKTIVSACAVFVGASLALVAACSSSEPAPRLGTTSSAIQPCPSLPVRGGANVSGPGGCPDPPGGPLPPHPLPPPAWTRTTCSTPAGSTPAAPDTYLVRTKPGIATCPNLKYVDTQSSCQKGVCHDYERYYWIGEPLFPENPAAGCRYTKGMPEEYTSADWRLIGDLAAEAGDPGDCGNSAHPPMIYKQCYAQSAPVVVTAAEVSPNAGQSILKKSMPRTGACKMMGMTTCPTCGMEKDPGADAGDAPVEESLYLVLDEHSATGGSIVFVGLPTDSGGGPGTWVQFYKTDTSNNKQIIKVDRSGIQFSSADRLWVGVL